MGLSWRELAALVVCILAALVVYIRLRPGMPAVLVVPSCYLEIGFVIRYVLLFSIAKKKGELKALPLNNLCSE